MLSGRLCYRCTEQSATYPLSSLWITVQRKGIPSAISLHFWQTCKARTTREPPPRKLTMQMRSLGRKRLTGHSSLFRMLTCPRYQGRSPGHHANKESQVQVLPNLPLNQAIVTWYKLTLDHMILGNYHLTCHMFDHMTLQHFLYRMT